tara:strand:- start:2403 stop:4808 length:2406 start_codon:yes stop_codon:yes gene_type:complete
MSTFEAQIILEYNMRVRGIERFNSRNSKRIDKNTESATSHGKYLLAVTLEPVTKALKTHVENRLKGHAGRVPISAIKLNTLEYDVTAAIALKVVLNSLTRGGKATETSINIGSAIEDEIRLRTFEETNKPLYTVIVKDIESRSSNYQYKRRKLLESAKRDGIEWNAWSLQEKIHVGLFLLGTIISETGLVEKRTVVKRGKKQDFLVPTKETMKFIKDRKTNLEVLAPDYYPCVIPPKDWDSPYGGGYHTEHVPKYPIIKTRNRKYLIELKDRPMPLVYTSINAMQRTGYKVNKNILEILETLWDSGSSLGGLPPSRDYEIPPKPIDIATNKEARIAWKREAVVVHTENNRIASQRLLVRKTTQIARQFIDEPNIYFPMQLDFRGRAYAVPSYLNFQNFDPAKALLLFSKGFPLGEQGACWLAIHGANTFGEDKISMQERVDWTQDNQEQIIACAENPYENKFWAEADKPFQFLAFCFEWKNFCEIGYDYLCPIAVALDGSSNGLQHFSAMLRSEVTGKEVNLVPMDKPQDIYQKVANNMTEKLKLNEHPYASLWLDFKIKRSTTKSPCMVVPYGGRRYGFTDFIRDDIRKRVHKGESHNFQDELKASSFLAGVVYESITEVVHAATDAMTWLQKAARIVCKENLPITWYSPSNFPIVQAYPEVKTQQITTKLMGKIYKPRIAKQTGNYDKIQQVNGISANFVHGLDSAHLCYTICTAVENGINHFTMVHDSYGTHPSNAELLSVCLRKSFVEMYKSSDVLEEFYDNIIRLLPPDKREALPPPPGKGNLDIEGVLNCDFFFS